jgi:hypothetical protein
LTYPGLTADELQSVADGTRVINTGWQIGDGKAFIAVAAYGLLSLIIYLNTNKRHELIQAAVCVVVLAVATVGEQFYIPSHHPLGHLGQTTDFGVWVCVAGFLLALNGVRQLLAEDKVRRNERSTAEATQQRTQGWASTQPS